jgi:hypothetical protein
MYKTKASAERAYRGYKGSKFGKKKKKLVQGAG